jgi:uncharacterized membrane protein
MDQIIAIVAPIVLGFVSKFPIAAGILMVVGVCRAVFKPVFAVARAYVQATPGKSDDETLDKVEQSKVVKGLAFVLDWFTSVKLPAAK